MKIKRCADGITRTVYLTGNYAIKVPSWRHGWRMFVLGLYANLDERSMWRRWKDDRMVSFGGRSYASMFCPVIWSAWGGWAIVMPRVEILTDAEYRQSEDPALTAFSDSKPENFGWYEGRIVCIDYGGVK